MKVVVITIAYKEERFIVPWLRHLPPWLEVVVLNSKTPWFGEAEKDDTADLATAYGAVVSRMSWESEHAQRNHGQVFAEAAGYDWVIWLDPDEFLTIDGWDTLLGHLESARGAAYLPRLQHTYWKSGYVIRPPEDYKQLIAARPSVRFVDKRVVDSAFELAPLELHHFSWARTDEECLRKITHYAHAQDFDGKQWYEEVWLPWKPEHKNLHPLTPPSLGQAVAADLPDELKRLNLWPSPIATAGSS